MLLELLEHMFSSRRPALLLSWLCCLVGPSGRRRILTAPDRNWAFENLHTHTSRCEISNQIDPKWAWFLRFPTRGGANMGGTNWTFLRHGSLGALLLLLLVCMLRGWTRLAPLRLAAGADRESTDRAELCSCSGMLNRGCWISFRVVFSVTVYFSNENGVSEMDRLNFAFKCLLKWAWTEHHNWIGSKVIQTSWITQTCFVAWETPPKITFIVQIVL